MPPPAFVVHHRRTGIAALNVVTAALDTDLRTADTEVVFAANREAMVTALVSACRRDGRAVAGWSFYSTDFAEATQELSAVRAATAGLDVLHVAGGAHASAEPEQTVAAGFDLAAIGEGETTIVELFATLRAGGDPRSLRGVAFHGGERFVSRGPGDFLFGLPEESEAEREASVALAERLVRLGAKIHNHAFLPLPGTPLKNASPPALEKGVVNALSRLESTGALYGGWREQLVRATDLVKQREAARSRRRESR